MGLPCFSLDPALPLASLLIDKGIRDFCQAARWVQGLTYGRNLPAADYLRVVAERRGTCSTKHAFLAALAREHNKPIRLMLGIYEMSGENTPGVGTVLDAWRLAGIPEAHCYLAYKGNRYDFTRDPSLQPPISAFLVERSIAPEEIGSFKRFFHQTFMKEWCTTRGLALDQAWQAREACIAALSSDSREAHSSASSPDPFGT